MISILPLLPGSALYGEELTKGISYEHLKTAKELLETQRYHDALSVLKEYNKEDRAVYDIALYFTALAERALRRFKESNETLKRLIEGYPDSPFLKKARAIGARNNISIIESGLDEATQGYESLVFDYIRSYPDDHEVSYLFAGYLKRKGDTEKAKDLFIKVYKGTSRFSGEALKEMTRTDITAEVLTEKASNHMKEMEYKEAEGLLRKALALRDGTFPQQEILKRLGQSLFMQKRYGEAAEVYLKSGDLYNAGRSYFRNGDMEGFNRLLSRLVQMSDRRAGHLMIALGAKKRREGDIDEALRLFAEVGKSYPYLMEDALWGKAWTYYRAGRYSDAHKVLSELNEKYPSKRYSYWMKKAGELRSSIGENCMVSPLKKGFERQIYSMRNSMEGQRDLHPDFSDFYSLLEYLGSSRDGMEGQINIGNKATGYQGHRVLSPLETPADLVRFNVLLSLGFKKEAITEVLKIWEDKKDTRMLVAAGYILQRHGAYKGAIKLAITIKDVLNTDDYRELMYPLAFWQYVESASRRYDIDPLLLLSVMREESRFEPEVRSPAGAIGLMQVMPVTASRMVNKAGLGTNIIDLKDVKTNIVIGAFYLKELLKDFGDLPAAIAAYNAGEERVRDWLIKGKYISDDEFIEDIPFDETKNYVKKVLMAYMNYLLLGYN